ncbi:hypothetical protein NOR_05582 [Metarhizium rileyi]|uniref:Uncharacterized protein n=1 Tax=Metarhizium rileyi (strain RCEF 4871) TaxID=1649241 RepID=A0A167CBE7_METRR|nr:hypothetical protein NOR_05582 [Metarhizium rileyi RCEF 4871]
MCTVLGMPPCGDLVGPKCFRPPSHCDSSTRPTSRQARPTVAQNPPTHQSTKSTPSTEACWCGATMAPCPYVHKTAGCGPLALSSRAPTQMMAWAPGPRRGLTMAPTLEAKD